MPNCVDRSVLLFAMDGLDGCGDGCDEAVPRIPKKKEKPRRPGDVMVRVRRFGPRSIFVCRPPVRSLVGRRPVRRPQSDDKSD